MSTQFHHLHKIYCIRNPKYYVPSFKAIDQVVLEKVFFCFLRHIGHATQTKYAIFFFPIFLRAAYESKLKQTRQFQRNPLKMLTEGSKVTLTSRFSQTLKIMCFFHYKWAFRPSWLCDLVQIYKLSFSIAWRLHMKCNGNQPSSFRVEIF